MISKPITINTSAYDSLREYGRMLGQEASKAVMKEYEHRRRIVFAARLLKDRKYYKVIVK